MLGEESFCRLCSEKDRMHLLITENQVIEMLESLTTSTISLNDTTPDTICSKCLEDLKTAYIIQQRIIKAEEQHDNNLFLSELSIDNKTTHNEIKISESEMNSKINLQSKRHLDFDNLQQEVQSLQLFDKTSEDAANHNQTFYECSILCEHCGEIFLNQQTFKTHVKSFHTGEYICEICGEDFFQTCKLREHIKLKHTKFICEVCNQTFSLRYVLHAHKQQHLNNNLHVCKVCGCKFKHRITLMLHKRMKHHPEPILQVGEAKN